MDSTTEPTAEQKKQFNNWAFTRHFGCGLGGIGAITAITYGWHYHWMFWLLLPALAAITAGVISHKHMRAHPDRYPPTPTEAEIHRAEAIRFEESIPLVGGGIVFFSTVIAVSTGIRWFLLGVPVGAGFGYTYYRIARSEYIKARRLEGKPTPDR